MSEYIVSIAENIGDEYVRGIGAIRKNSQQLIRCKDCKHYCNEDEIYISEEGFATTECIFMPTATENDFCSRAERKEEK